MQIQRLRPGPVSSQPSQRVQEVRYTDLMWTIIALYFCLTLINTPNRTCARPGPSSSSAFNEAPWKLERQSNTTVFLFLSFLLLLMVDLHAEGQIIVCLPDESAGFSFSTISLMKELRTWSCARLHSCRSENTFLGFRCADSLNSINSSFILLYGPISVSSKLPHVSLAFP